MLLLKVPKMRALKGAMALIAYSIGGKQCASAQMLGHLRSLDAALLSLQGEKSHLKVDYRPEVCHYKGRFVKGLCADFDQSCKALEI